MKRKILQRLAIFTSTAAMIMSGMPISAAPRTINSYGMVTATDPDTGANVTIDADDIRNNYAAIYKIQQQLSGLDGRTLEWSDELGTYVIKTYKTDENGNVLTDDDGNPIVESEEAIGALGTADPTMVVENRTFSSLYAKTIYNGDSTLKAPGVQQNGTLVDVLGNGFTSAQVNGKASYADNDTVGTDSSTRPSGGMINSTTGGERTDKLNINKVQYTDPAKTIKDGITQSTPNSSTIHNGSYSSSVDGKQTLSKNSTNLTLGINESITLPAGFYSKNITLNNGVVNNTDTARVTIANTIGSIDSEADNKAFDSGNKHITDANNTYDINNSLNLGANANVTLPSGYYAKDILIQNTVKDILGSEYDSEDGVRYKVGTYTAKSTTNGNNSTTNVDINDSDNQDIIVGVNESVTFPAGFYSKKFTVNNGVADTTAHGSVTVNGTIGGIDTKETDTTITDGNIHITTADETYAIANFNEHNPINIGAGASFTFPVGYYSKAIKVQNTVKDILGSKYDTENGTRYVVKSYDAVVSSNGNNSTTNVDIDDEENQDITLGINESVTLPAGYYSKEVTLNNGVADTTAHGSISISGTIGGIDIEETDTTMKDGNGHITNKDSVYAIAGLNDSDNPINIGAGASFTFPVGYYSKAIKVKSTVKDILGDQTIAANTHEFYQPGSNLHGTSSDVARLTNEHTDLTLGVNDLVTLPAGFYSDTITIKNGVRNNALIDEENKTTSNVTGTIGSIDDKADNKSSVSGNLAKTTANGNYILGEFNNTSNAINLGAGASINLPAGYYDNLTITNSVKDILGIASLPKNVKGVYHATTDNTGTSNDHEVISNDDTILTLGVNEKTTLPAGYYSKEVTINNGVADRGSVKNRIDSVDSNDIPGGYYVPSSLANSVKYQELVTTLGDILGKPWGSGNGETIPTLAEINGENGFGGFDKTALQKVTSVTGKSYTGGSNKFLGTNGSNGESKLSDDATYTVSDNTNGTYQLGAGEQIIFPAGFYAKSQTVQNGAKIIKDINVTTDKTLNRNNAGISGLTNINEEQNVSLGIDKKVTIPAGYYEKDYTVYNSVENKGTQTANLSASILSKTYSAGYYDNITVSINKSSIKSSAAASTELNTKSGWTTGLNAGESVTLTAGAIYNGTITANSLASQTVGTATADNILSGKTAWVNGVQVSGNIGNASVSGAINSNDGYTVSIPAKKYTGNGSSVTVNKAVVTGATNSSDGYTATIAANAFTGKSGSSVTIAKGTVSGAVNSNDGYTASIAAGKYTGAKGSSVTVNKATVTGAAQSDGTFKYSIAAGSYTGKNGSSGSIAKLTPTYSSGSSQTAVKAGGTVTLPAGTYNKDKVIITAASLASQTPGTATAGDILSGKTAWKNGEKITGTMPINPSNGIQSAVSAVGVDNNIYIRMPAAAYLNKASSGYPELVINKQQLIKQALGGYHFDANATSVGFAENSSWPEGGYGHVHMPEGYYGPNDGTTDFSSWAPEVRLTKSQVRDLARACVFAGGSISDSTSTTSATANGNVGLSGTINLDRNKKLVVAAGYTDGFTVQNVASGGSFTFPVGSKGKTVNTDDLISTINAENVYKQGAADAVQAIVDQATNSFKLEKYVSGSGEETIEYIIPYNGYEHIAFISAGIGDGWIWKPSLDGVDTGNNHYYAYPRVEMYKNGVRIGTNQSIALTGGLKPTIFSNGEELKFKVTYWRPAGAPYNQSVPITIVRY